MQDNHSKEFDLQLRSMLEDAEVKPSPRVWRGVSARLDADKAPAAAPWAWMKWAGMALAAAAAIALGVFYSAKRTSIPTIHHNQEQALLAEAGEPAGDLTDVTSPEASVPGDAAAQTAEERPVRRSAAARRAAGQPVESAEAAVPADEPASASTDVQQETAPQATPAQERKAAPQRNRPTATEPFTDPFAENPVKRAARPRVALYAQGALGSNDSDFRPAPTAWMAPGAETGFSELSSSTYGVPFTIGVGARFYLQPRLSIATGIDYSLLTRSFTGSFNNESGSVSHSLQYLGVPLNLYYDIVSADRIKFYVYGGGEAEWCISNKYRLFGNPDIIRSYPVEGLQFSVGGGLGVEFRLTNLLGIYVDPGVKYYFPGNQPRSIRTDKPLLLNFDAGLRFNF